MVPSGFLTSLGPKWSQPREHLPEKAEAIIGEPGLAGLTRSDLFRKIGLEFNKSAVKLVGNSSQFAGLPDALNRLFNDVDLSYRFHCVLPHRAPASGDFTHAVLPRVPRPQLNKFAPIRFKRHFLGRRGYPRTPLLFPVLSALTYQTIGGVLAHSNSVGPRVDGELLARGKSVSADGERTLPYAHLQRVNSAWARRP